MPGAQPGNDGGIVPIPDLTNPNLYDPATGSFTPIPTGATPSTPPTVGSAPTNTGRDSVPSTAVTDDGPSRSTLPPSNK